MSNNYASLEGDVVQSSLTLTSTISDDYSGQMKRIKLFEEKLQIVFLIITILLLILQFFVTVRDMAMINKSINELTNAIYNFNVTES